jgi:hypothetical protein
VTADPEVMVTASRTANFLFADQNEAAGAADAAARAFD